MNHCNNVSRSGSSPGAWTGDDASPSLNAGPCPASISRKLVKSLSGTVDGSAAERRFVSLRAMERSATAEMIARQRVAVDLSSA